MSQARRWVVASGVAAALAALVAVDVAQQPLRPPSRGFAVVDALSAATPSSMSTVGLVASDYERLSAPVGRDQPLTVAQVEDMVRQAVLLAGGLHQSLPPDADWVVIKPNIVELKEPGSGVVTDWRVVRALIRIVHETAPDARITIAEGGAWIPAERAAEFGDMLENPDGAGDGFAIAGYRALLADPELAGIDLDIVDLNLDEAQPVQVPGGGYVFQTYYIPTTILECDFLITVPVLKVIGAVGMTNALKNFVGIAPGAIYGWPKMRGTPGHPGLPHMPEILDEVIVDLTCLAEADYAVVDAIVGMERGKTDENGEGIARRLNTVLASADIVAADAVSALLIGFNPADLEYLSLAAYRGLGQDDPAHIKIKGSPLEKVRTRFEKYPARFAWYGEHGHYGQGCRTWLLAGPFDRRQEQPGAEFIDVAQPGAAPGQNGWSDPVYFHDDKIDLDKYFDDPSDCVVYAYTELDAPRSEAAELWVGSDEGLRVWIDGGLVYEHAGRRRHQLPNDRVPIRLEAGRHRVVVRAEQSRSRFDFSLNVCEVEPDPRYDGNRVQGLTFFVPAAAGQAPATTLGARAVAAQTSALSDRAVILPVRTSRDSFDPLLSGLRACLEHRGERVDTVALAGLTGHAFRLCVGDSLERDYARQPDLPEGPAPYERLGYQVTAICAPAEAPDLVDVQLRAWDLISRSIEAGTPAIAHLGWSYRLIVGCDPRRELYLAESWRGDEPEPIELDQLGGRGGGFAVLVLGGPAPVDARAARLASLRTAVAEAHREDDLAGKRSFGFRAYERWAAALESGQVADRRGPALAAGVLLAARTSAGAYLESIAADFPAPAAERLRAAAQHYRAETAVLEQLAARYPYRRGRGQAGPGGARAGAPAADPAADAQLVRRALAADREAVAAVQAALQALGEQD